MSEIGSIQPEPEFAAFIGIDWADQKHNLVFANCRLGEAWDRRAGTYPGSSRVLGRPLVAAFCSAPDRRGGGAIARSSSPHYSWRWRDL